MSWWTWAAAAADAVVAAAEAESEKAVATSKCRLTISLRSNLPRMGLEIQEARICTCTWDHQVDAERSHQANPELGQV